MHTSLRYILHCPAWDHVLHPEYVDDDHDDDNDALLSCCVQLPLDSVGFCLMCAEVIHKRDIAIDSYDRKLGAWTETDEAVIWWSASETRWPCQTSSEKDSESARRQDPASMHCPAWDHVLHPEYVDDDDDALLSCCVQLPLDSLGFCLMCAVYQANRLTDSSTDNHKSVW